MKKPGKILKGYVCVKNKDEPSGKAFRGHVTSTPLDSGICSTATQRTSAERLPPSSGGPPSARPDLKAALYTTGTMLPQSDQETRSRCTIPVKMKPRTCCRQRCYSARSHQHALASEQGTHQTVTWTDAQVSAGQNKASPRFHLPEGVGNNYLASPRPPVGAHLCSNRPDRPSEATRHPAQGVYGPAQGSTRGPT